MNELGGEEARVEKADTGVGNVERKRSATVERVEAVVDPELPGDHRRDGRLDDEVSAVHAAVDEQLDRLAVIGGRGQAPLGGAARKLERGGRRLRRKGKDPDALDAGPGGARGRSSWPGMGTRPRRRGHRLAAAADAFGEIVKRVEGVANGEAGAVDREHHSIP